MSNLKKALRSKEVKEVAENFWTTLFMTHNLDKAVSSIKNTAKQNGADKKIISGIFKDGSDYLTS